MQLEVVAVAVVETAEVHLFGSCEPTSRAVIDEESANPAEVGLALFDDLSKTAEGGAVDSIHFEAVDGRNGEVIRQLEGIVRILRQRLCEIAGLDLRASEVCAP